MFIFQMLQLKLQTLMTIKYQKYCFFLGFFANYEQTSQIVLIVIC